MANKKKPATGKPKPGQVDYNAVKKVRERKQQLKELRRQLGIK